MILKKILGLLVYLYVANTSAGSVAWEEYAKPGAFGLVGKSYYGKILTLSDVRAMDVMCKHVVAFFVMAENGSSSPFPQNYPLMETVEFKMAKGVNFNHHYCDAQIEKNRYLVLSNSGNRARALRDWESGIQYCINAAEYHFPSWSYRYLLYAQMADIGINKNNPYFALDYAKKAIALDKKYAPAYVAASDALVLLNKKSEAVSFLELGLSNSDSTKALARRYSELTGKKVTVKKVQDSVETPTEKNTEHGKLPVNVEGPANEKAFGMGDKAAEVTAEIKVNAHGSTTGEKMHSGVQASSLSISGNSNKSDVPTVVETAKKHRDCRFCPD